VINLIIIIGKSEKKKQTVYVKHLLLKTCFCVFAENNPFVSVSEFIAFSWRFAFKKDEHSLSHSCRIFDFFKVFAVIGAHRGREVQNRYGLSPGLVL
jgi:hypothetical protein